MNNFDIIREILKSNEGKDAVKTMKGLDQNNIKNKIQSIDKDEVVRKLNEMNLGPIAKKLQNTSKDQLLNKLSNNPELLKKLGDILK